MRRALLVFACALTSSTVAFAQRIPPHRPPGMPPVPELRPQNPRESGKLRDRFGVAYAQRLMTSVDPSERRRGLRRLASLGTPQAIDLLVRSQDPGTALSTDLRARLEAARGLAPHASEDGPRQALLDMLADSAREGPSDDVELWPPVRDTAALGLAKYGGEPAIEALSGLARQGGALGAAASSALRAYPPRELSWLLGAHAAMTPHLARLLGSLGDLRAIEALRRSVREGDAETRSESLVSLAKLGDAEAAPIARSWTKAGDTTAKLVAARALSFVAPAEARTSLASLLTDARARNEALSIAETIPGKELTGALAGLLSSNDVPSKRRAIETLGRIDDPRAAGVLLTVLGDGAVAAEAALALATSPSSHARTVLENALVTPSSRAVALRAGAVRALSLDDAPKNLVTVARASLADEATRDAATFALLATKELEPDDPSLLARDATLGALGRAAMGAGDHALRKLLPALAASGDDMKKRDALGVALLAAPDGGEIGTTTLLAWVEARSAIAPLALRAIAARDDESTRSRVTALFASGDPVLRAHVAAGLARSPEPSAAGRLANAYTYETDVRVRRSIVRALAARTEAVRGPTLALAATLDPDASVRALANASLEHPRVDRADARDVAWIVVEGASANASFRVERADDLAVPAVPDADGSLLVPGLSTGPARASLAAFASPTR